MSDEEKKDGPETPQSKGGRKRAESLTPEDRKMIATKAAAARWAPRAVTVVDPDRIPQAVRQGKLELGDVVLDCYHLDDGRRVFNKRAIARAIGLRSAGGNAFKKTISRVGSALGPKLQHLIDNPFVFSPLGVDPGSKGGNPGHGYDATVLIDICEALIRAWHDGKLAPSQEFLARQGVIILRASAKLGIIALIDEATGYQEDKRKDEYRKLFQTYVQEQVRKWEKEFPDVFFDMLYRIYGLKRRNPNSFQHPQFFGRFILKYIFHPLANSNGAILENLDELNPVVYVGGRRRGRRFKLFQFLTENVGLEKFRAHLWQVVGIGNSVTDKAAFDRAFARAFPQIDPQLELDLSKIIDLETSHDRED